MTPTIIFEFLGLTISIKVGTSSFFYRYFNSIPQLAEAVISDRNSKGHPQNEVNQKELPQLEKNFTK